MYSYSYETATVKNLIARKAVVAWMNSVGNIYGKYFVKYKYSPKKLEYFGKLL